MARVKTCHGGAIVDGALASRFGPGDLGLWTFPKAGARLRVTNRCGAGQ